MHFTSSQDHLQQSLCNLPYLMLFPAQTDYAIADELGLSQVREANQMVEEMMLLANCTVAEHILANFATCALLRKHAVPPPRQFEPLLQAATACGIELDVASSKVSVSPLSPCQTCSG